MASDSVDLPMDLYRRNAFRMLGLSTEASFRAIKRREQKFNTAIEMGESDAVAQLIVGTFMGLPDEPAVRLSSSRLGDPYQRLIDELFWLRFSDDDEATVQRLHSRDPDSIVDLLTAWETVEESADENAALQATHNLAVFYHMLAIEIEHKIEAERNGAKSVAARLKALQSISGYCWAVALPRWRAVLSADATWKWLHERAPKIDKRRLTREDVEAIRREAESAVLGILVNFMIPAANRGWNEEVERLRLIARKAGFDDKLLAATARDIVGARIDEIVAQITASVTRMEAEKAAAKAITSQLIEELEPKIKAFRLVLDKNDTRLVALEDSFSTAANKGQIIQWNENHDDEFSLNVLRRIKPYVHSPQLTARIDEDIENTLCFFCKEGARRKSSACEVKMWRITNVEPLFGRYGLSTCSIQVPRCEVCAGKGTSRGSEQHNLVQRQKASGWRIGSSPSQEDIRAAFRNAS